MFSHGGIESNFVTHWITAYTAREQSLEEKWGKTEVSGVGGIGCGGLFSPPTNAHFYF